MKGPSPRVDVLVKPVVIDLQGADLPIMCVIFAMSYEVGDHVEAPSIDAGLH